MTTKLKIRPDSEGFWWCKEKWGIKIGEVKLMQWDDEDPHQVLAFRTGGCFLRCDYINKLTDDGSRYMKAQIPKVIIDKML